MKSRLVLSIFILSLFLVKSFAQITRPPVALMGNKMLKDYFQNHLVYPEESLKNNVEGTVEIEFTIDINGNVSSKKIISSVTPEIDKEALRLFNLIIWKPALNYGIAIVGSDILRISFKVKKYNKTVKRRGYEKIIINYKVDTSYIIYNKKSLEIAPEPILPNEYNSIYDYVYKQMKYPKQAAELEIEGKVEISFIIETNGLPSNFVVNQSIGGGCTGEALRIVKDIKWKPGFKEELAVRSKKIMFIEFKLSNIKSGKHVPNQSNSGL